MAVAKRIKQDASELINPFRAKTERTASVDVVEAPGDLKGQLDEFVGLKRQISALEEKADNAKGGLVAFGQAEYADRRLSGVEGNFKIRGDEHTINFICKAPSGTLGEKERASFEANFGKRAAASLLKIDYGSFRFNGEVLEKHFDLVLGALNTLPKNVLESLIIPAGYRAVDGAADKAASLAKDPDAYLSMLKALRVQTYVAAC